MSKNWSKRAVSFMTAVLLLAVSVVSVFASSSSESVHSGGKAWLVDPFDYVADGMSVTQINKRIEEIRQTVGWDIFVYINENNVDYDDMMEYTDTYCETEFEFSDDHSGVGMVIDMASRCIWISTFGEAIKYFTDERIDSTVSAVGSYLQDEDYETACYTFIEDSLYYYQQGMGEYIVDPDGYKTDMEGNRITDENDNFVDEYGNPKFDSKWDEFVYGFQRHWWIALIIGVIAGGITCLVIFQSYKKKGQSHTYDFDNNCTFAVVEHKDELYDTDLIVTKVPRNDDHSSGGSGGGFGGGSSTHSTGGGNTAGGGGGRF